MGKPINPMTDNKWPEPALLELIHDFARGRSLEVTARSLGRDPSEVRAKAIEIGLIVADEP
jgi:hypothetical protein